jgi:D-beta-D-heptose 7-phosphate kinase/D-beta-D-heptose 1-phosphate adenosyltransferase
MKRADFARMAKIVRSFENRRMVVFGDVMLDRFVRGSVNRISPEAPVPVVRVAKESSLPGGSGNVAANLSALGAKVSLVSLAGEDASYFELTSNLQAHGVDTSFIQQEKDRPTIEKVRVIAEHQQVVRFDRESSEPVAKTTLDKCAQAFENAIKDAGAAILSDYGKGLLTTANIPFLVNACRHRKLPVCVDPKVEHFLKYRDVTCITPNTKEAWEGMRMTAHGGQPEVEDLGRKMLDTLNAETVLITQGANGMTLMKKSARKNPFHIPTVAREVYDVTGAGDTVISVFTLALACGASYEDAAVIANHAAGIVVAKLGTATVTREELLKELNADEN